MIDTTKSDTRNAPRLTDATPSRMTGNVLDRAVAGPRGRAATQRPRVGWLLVGGLILAAFPLGGPVAWAHPSRATAEAGGVPLVTPPDGAAPFQAATPPGQEQASPKGEQDGESGAEGEGTPVSAQEVAGSRYDAELSFEFLTFDNFFQAPAGAPATNIYAARTIGRLGYRVSRDTPLVVYGELGRTFYDDLDDGTLVRGGVDYDDGIHSLVLWAGVETDRPVLDVGDEFEPANVVTVDAEYGYEFREDWELKGQLQLQDQSFEVSRSKDNQIVGVGPAVRYRGFGYEFSPEVGVLFGGRDATNNDEDHSQTDLYIQVRSVPAPPVYLSFRYRHRMRDYDTMSPLSRNFQREDTRRQFTALAVIEVFGPINLNVYYAFQDAESTLPTRTFNTQLLFAGLSYVVR